MAPGILVSHDVIVVRLQWIITVQGTFFRVGLDQPAFLVWGAAVPAWCQVWWALVCPPSPVEVECVVPSLSSVGSIVSAAASERGSAARADELPDVKH